MADNGKSFTLSDVYGLLVDWPKRLAGEEPFYRRLFERFGVGKILDAACGTGEHAALFHSWGLEVEGADIDGEMIAGARRAFGEPPGLRWSVRGFGEAVPGGRTFDAVLCVGNSLAMSPDAGEAEKAVEKMAAAVAPGGALVIHLLNLRRIEEGPCLWQKCRRVSRPEGEYLIVKGIHRSAGKAHIELILVPLADPASFQSTSIPLTELEAENLAETARRCGAGTVEFYGGYKEQPWDRGGSVDLVMIAAM